MKTMGNEMVETRRQCGHNDELEWTSYSRVLATMIESSASGWLIITLTLLGTTHTTPSYSR